jgi:hypothetical protein
MRALIASAAAVLAVLGLAGAAQAAPSVEIKDAVARVTVIPENRTDVKVEMLTTNPDLPITIEVRGDRTVVNGGLRWNRIRDCRSHNGRVMVMVRDVGEVTWEKMPQIVIRVPLNVEVGADGAVFGAIGRADSVDLANAGCGDWQVANVKGELKVSVAGSGDTKAGTSGNVRISIAGSGDVLTSDVGGGAEVNVAGSGDVHLSSINGDLSVSVAGSGDVTVDRGSAPDVRVNIAGSGDTDFGGTAGALKANIMGSGDVHVAAVTGDVHKAVMGSGDVVVGGH